MTKQLPIRRAARTVIFDESSDKIAILEVKSGDYHKITGGGVESEENLKEAAMREALEEGNLLIDVSKKIKNLFELSSNGSTSRPPSQDKIMQYAELFYLKTEAYFKKINHIMLGEIITTKLIRMTADRLNREEQVLLNKPSLLSCELDNLLK